MNEKYFWVKGGKKRKKRLSRVKNAKWLIRRYLEEIGRIESEERGVKVLKNRESRR